jgi:oligopeptide/dipeptide ABC transporter ATP-binding protein
MSSTRSAAPLLEVSDLTIAYPGDGGLWLPVVQRLSFALAPGESLGIVGESGSGKSQTALALMGLLPAAAKRSGQIRLAGVDLLNAKGDGWADVRGQRIGMVFQDPMTSLNPYLRIGQQITEMGVLHGGMSQRAATAQALRLLAAVEVANPAQRLQQYPHQLSGGLRQRVLLAMMLMAEPELLIADEPTTALDATVQARLLALLAQLRRDLRLSLILISHDLGVVQQVADAVLVLYGGQLMEQGPTAEVLRSPRHPYTQALIACRPSLGRTSARALPTIAGQPPQRGEQSDGCPFAPRCALADAQCQAETIRTVAISSRRRLACHHPGVPA